MNRTCFEKEVKSNSEVAHLAHFHSNFHGEELKKCTIIEKKSPSRVEVDLTLKV